MDLCNKYNTSDIIYYQYVHFCKESQRVITWEVSVEVLILLFSVRQSNRPVCTSSSSTWQFTAQSFCALSGFDGLFWVAQCTESWYPQFQEEEKPCSVERHVTAVECMQMLHTHTATYGLHAWIRLWGQLWRFNLETVRLRNFMAKIKQYQYFFYIKSPIVAIATT